MKKQNWYLKKILDKVDATRGEKNKLYFCIAYPKYTKEIIEHIAETSTSGK